MQLVRIPGKSPRAHLILLFALVMVVGGEHVSIVRSLAAQIPDPTLQPTAPAQASTSPGPQNASDWNRTIDSSQKIISALAIIVGGFWAWLKFFRGRTFRSRLELVVSAKMIENGSTKFLKATMEMKNVGLSQVKLKGDAIYLDVYLIDARTVAPADQLYSAMWNEPVTFAVFQDHGWIEPAEEISDQILFQLPEREQFACKLQLTVNSRSNSWIFFKTEGTRWRANDIVDCRPPLKADELPPNEKGQQS
jgi:hypothetical protein